MNCRSNDHLHPLLRACLCWLLLAAVATGTGCHKAAKNQPTSTVETSQPPADTHPPIPVQHAPAVSATSPQGGADLKQLNHIYIGWIAQHHRRPKSFEEFVAWSGIQVPPPPAGKKYVIDKNGFIGLADQ